MEAGGGTFGVLGHNKIMSVEGVINISPEVELRRDGKRVHWE
jgi:hypothetical protein